MQTTTGAATVCANFQATAERYAGEVALRGDSEVLTWADYAARVDAAARGLAALGVGRGDSVAMLLGNRPEFHILDVAAVHLGAIGVSIYNTATAEQICHVVSDSGARVLLHEPRFADVVAGCGAEHLLELDGLPAGDPDFEIPWRDVDPDDVATIIYTSGTTGPPKGVMITHANLTFAWDCSVAAVPALARRGRYLSYLPTAHLADRIFSHYPALITGSEITCVADPRAAVGLLPTVRPTLWMTVPRIWEKLKDAMEAAGEHAPTAAQLGLDEADLLVSGAAPIRPDVLDFFAARGIEICEGYGMTESTAVGTLNRPGRTRSGTVGEPLPGVEVQLAADGEVLIRSAGVMAGYRNQPAQTAETIDTDGWLHTGDVGAFDPDGRLRIVDRKKELIINAAGKNMSPANIEARLREASPLIGFAMAVGDNRPYNTALIVLDPDLPTPTDIEATIAAAVDQANIHLSRVEQIKRFTLLPDTWAIGGELVTPTVKLRRRAIADRYAAVIEAMYSRG